MTVIRRKRPTRTFPPVEPEALEKFKAALASATPGPTFHVGDMRDDFHAALQLAMEAEGTQPRGVSDWSFSLNVADRLLPLMPTNMLRLLLASRVAHLVTDQRRRQTQANMDGVDATNDDAALEPKRSRWAFWR